MTLTISVFILAVQLVHFADGLSARNLFSFADSLFVLIFCGLLCWSFVHGYRWARFALAYFVIAMVATSTGGFFSSAGSSVQILGSAIYLMAAFYLIVPTTAMLGALESARTAALGPDEVLPGRQARRRGQRILLVIIVAAIAAQLTWMLPAWWRMGTLPGLTEAAVMSVIGMIAYGLLRRSENARAWAWLLSFGACFWFLTLGVFAPEPNDFFIAIGLAHLAIPSALVSWRSVQIYFGDKDLDAKWEYVRPTPRRPKAWGEEAGSAGSTETQSARRSR